MRHEVKEGTHTPCSASITIAEAGAAWLAQAETDCREASTVTQYRQHLNYHIIPFLGAEKVTEHVPASIQEFPQPADSRSPLARHGKEGRDEPRRHPATSMAAERVARNVVREHARTRQRRLETRPSKRLEVATGSRS